MNFLERILAAIIKKIEVRDTLMKTYSAIAVANEFIVRAREINDDITPMKVQKLVYFAHAWHLALTGLPLIKDKVMAWKFGPVIESIYAQFSKYGRDPIKYLATETVRDPELGDIPVILDIPEGDEAHKMIDRIWEVYGALDAIELSNLTHIKHSPWEVTKDKHQEGQVRNYQIPNAVIRDQMKILMQEN